MGTQKNVGFTHILVGLSLVGCIFTEVKSQDDQEEWMFNVQKIGEPMTFNCTQSNAPNDSVPTSWMLPDLKIVDLNFDDGNRMVKNGSSGRQFHFRSVQKEHFGTYHCMMKTSNGEWFLIRRGLNLQGPYFQNLWEKYRMNVILGFSVGGGFLALMAVLCLTYHFRWQPPKDACTDYMTYTGAPVESGLYDKPYMPTYDNVVPGTSGDDLQNGKSVSVTMVNVKCTGDHAYVNPAIRVDESDTKM